MNEATQAYQPMYKPSIVGLNNPQIEQRRTEVQAANDNVNDAVNQLDKLLEELTSKLRPIIRPMPKLTDQNLKPEVQFSTQLANQINNHSIVLSRINGKVADLLSNIEL